jgi:hypothetical protein
LLKSALADAGQGGKRRESGVYTGVNEHFESFSNAERRRPSVFQKTARVLQMHSRRVQRCVTDLSVCLSEGGPLENTPCRGTRAAPHRSDKRLLQYWLHRWPRRGGIRNTNSGKREVRELAIRGAFAQGQSLRPTHAYPGMGIRLGSCTLSHKKPMRPDNYPKKKQGLSTIKHRRAPGGHGMQQASFDIHGVALASLARRQTGEEERVQSGNTSTNNGAVCGSTGRLQGDRRLRLAKPPLPLN